ncbi:hypothetical protein KHA80_06510 [Anaerobacillus sp. HL2]|nr:hypothetical protein KHA80_06510 [Anaerobacillus sp. HL2]
MEFSLHGWTSSGLDVNEMMATIAFGTLHFIMVTLLIVTNKYRRNGDV